MSRTTIKKLAFFGAKIIGASCLECLIVNQKKLNFEIIAVLTNKRGEGIIKLAASNGIRVLDSLDQYLEIDDIDLLVSVQYNEILKAPHIAKARQASVNLHMAPVPEYRGCNQFSFSILNGEKYFGTTIHIIDSGIDSGDVIYERRFAIPSDIWVQELVELTERHSLEMFREFLPNLIEGNYSRVTQDELQKSRKIGFHKRNAIDLIKKLELDWSSEKLSRYIRALSMPGFSAPYFIIDGKKIFLNIDDE